MESFNLLPQIIHYATSDPTHSYNMLAPHIQYLSPFIESVLPELEMFPNHFALSLIYFSLRDYKKAIMHYLQCNGQNCMNFDPIYYMFFQNAIKVRIVEYFNDKDVQEYIIANSENDPLLITFCMTNKELLRRLLQKTQIPLSVLLCVAEEEEALDLFYEVVADSHVVDSDLRILVDACVFMKLKIKLIMLIENLIVTDIPKCYEISFYISEMHPTFFTLQDISSVGNFINAESEEMKGYEADPEITDNISQILLGDLKRKTLLYLMARNNKTDFTFLGALVKPLTRSSSSHSAVTYANSIMNLGTSNDTFFRMNQDLMNNAKHWNKFISIASLGMIHLGTDGLSILRNIFPSEAKDEGGAFLALGLIEHMNGERDETVQAFLLNNMEEGNVSIKFGSALGYGLINMGKGDSSVQRFYENLSAEDVGSEGAALGIGMLLVGRGMGSGSRRGKAIDVVRSVIRRVAESPNSTPTLKNQMKESKYLVEERPDAHNHEHTKKVSGSRSRSKSSTDESYNYESSDQNVVDEDGKLKCVYTDPDFDPENPHENSYILESASRLYTIANETEHERLSRSCGIALALLAIQTHTIDIYVNNMVVHRSDVLRYSGCFCIGAAFAGTSNLNTITLLSSLMNDSSEDVKRACILALGFVCCNKHDVLLNVLEPLATNHSPGIRGAVALALGFFMSGTGNRKCCDIIEVLLYDIDNLVRQSASIGIGFLLAQTTSNNTPNFKRIVERINYLIIEKFDTNAVNIGAVIGRSLMEGGGRNIIYGVKNLYGKIEKTKIASAIIFMQYWYNYSLLSFVSLTVLPTFYVVMDYGLGYVETEIKTKSKKETYDVNSIKLPEFRVKKRRYYRRRYKYSFCEDEVEKKIEDVVIPNVIEVEETEYYIKSSERMSVWEKKGAGVKDYGFKFV